MFKPQSVVQRFAYIAFLILGLILVLVQLGQTTSTFAAVDSTQVTTYADRAVITTNEYEMGILYSGFRFGFTTTTGAVIPAHHWAGMTFGGANVASTVHNSTSVDNQIVQFTVTNVDGAIAVVKVYPKADAVRISVEPTVAAAQSIETRVGPVNGPHYGLADYGRNGNLSNLVDYVLENDGGNERFISTFSIAPNSSFAHIAISQIDERALDGSNQNVPHRVNITDIKTELGVDNVTSVRNFYYFMGSPQAIYKAFSEAKTETGYPDVKPVYGMFGVGWEAWPFLHWDTNSSCVQENIEEFINRHDYPLSWAVIGSGFWEEGGTTTSFGRWNETKYPDANNNDVADIVEFLHTHDIKVILGLRTNFVDCLGSDVAIDDVTYEPGTCFTPHQVPAEYTQGVANNYFAKIDQNQMFTSRSQYFPRWDSSMVFVDADNSAANNWYRDGTALWQVDGWKEDTMITTGMYHDAAWNAPMKRLHERGDYVIARNAYVSSPGSIQRMNDTFGEEDRIPQLVLAYGASGAPNVYTDIVGNLEGDNARYIERHAKLAALTASMSFGTKPWTLSTSANIRAAVDWHELYRPYIYSAALKAHATGYPYTATPLPIAYPTDALTYNLDDTKMWQWLIDESMLAHPIFDNTDSSGLRDVYLPAGVWIDMNTNVGYTGPVRLNSYNHNGPTMPVFVGGKGVTVSAVGTETVSAEIWPIKPNDQQVRYEYHHHTPDGNGDTLVSEIQLHNTGWDTGQLQVMNTTTAQPVTDIQVNASRGSISFLITPGNNYQVTGGGTRQPGGPLLQATPTSLTDDVPSIDRTTNPVVSHGGVYVQETLPYPNTFPLVQQIDNNTFTQYLPQVYVDLPVCMRTR